ncbi:MAG: nucleoside-diphosphate sugar epimerase/dehydratase [Pseudomonadota bacterium]
MKRFNPRLVLAFAHDLLAASLAWLLAYLLRFNFDIPPEFQKSMALTLPWLLPLHAVFFWHFGLYRGLWRFASVNDLKRILLATSLVGLLITATVYGLSLPGVPRSVLLLHPLILILLMGGSRFAYRSWKEERMLSVRSALAKPVLVMGAGCAAHSLLRELSLSTTWSVVGLLDDNPAKRGRSLGCLPILGTLDRVAEFAERFGVEHVIIAMPSARSSARRRATELAAEAKLIALTVPAFDDLLSGKLAVSQIRQVELEDLLGRDRVELDDAQLHECLDGKTILVSGAGGSIGSELCRQIAGFKPQRLVLLELSELALYQIAEEFAAQFPLVTIFCIIADVKDERRLAHIFAEYQPQLVFHAAAYKHVPLMESDNAWEAIRNNVLGTLHLARAAQRQGAEKFVLISTDKAVNPVNVMGASKRLAERVCQALQQADGTRFVTVRFGNVLGSNGSVIPKFRAQIAQGGPVTVTHPEIIRYFMLIPEAVQLVLQAGSMGHGGEIFLLDMGNPVKIADLARDMIHLSGFSTEEIEVVFTGLRPGEKLFEELLANDEESIATPHPKLRMAKPDCADTAASLASIVAIEHWTQDETVQSNAQIKQVLQKFVPEYVPAAATTRAIGT